MRCSPRPIRVLFVEDNARDVALVRDLLAAGGGDAYEFSHVERIAEATIRLLTETFDLVLLDLRLPDCTGPAAVTRLRDAARGLPIVVLTGLEDDDLGLECIAMGAEDYLCKNDLHSRSLKRILGYAIARRREAAANQELELLVQATPDALIVVDRDGLVLFANSTAERLFGKQAAGLVGQPFGFPIRSDEGSDLEIVVSGTVRFAQMRIAEVVWHGSPAFLAAIRDTTEARLLAEGLQRSQRLEAVGRLAGGVAHDFNNIATVVRTYCDLVRDQLDADDPAMADLDEMQSAVDRAGELTMQLLTFSKQQPVRTRAVNVEAVIEDVHKMLSRTLGEDIELSIGLAQSVWKVSANAGQLEQVLMNLAFNARDAMRDGGRVIVQASNVTSTAPSKDLPVGDYVCLQVSDTGEGIPPEVQERIFEPFFTTKEEGKGSGLGLATCYGIVRQCGGDITVESTVGEGTTVNVWLPRTSESVERDVRHTEPPLSDSRGVETIIVVEDDGALRRSTSRALRSRGYTVFEAADGKEALRLLEAHDTGACLILTDVIMPRMGGTELVRRLHEEGRKTKVLFMTGYMGDAVIPQSLDGPDVDILHKPFSTDALLKKVKAFFDRASSDFVPPRSAR